MRRVRLAAAALLVATAGALAVAAVIAFAAGVDAWVAGVYAGVAFGLVSAARRVRPRRRFVFARH
jgi:hypothetical protein